MGLVNERANLEDGRRKINWVSKHMKVLNKIREKFSSDKPLNGIKISASLHLEAKTAHLVRTLRDLGAILYVTGANPYSTKDDVALALSREKNVEVFALEGENGVKVLEDLRGKTLEINPNVIIDDGAELTEIFMKMGGGRKGDFYGVCEETTSGVDRFKMWEREGKIDFPVVPVNSAYMKHLFDNRYGTGQSVWDAIMRTTNMNIAGKNVLVLGFGWCGRGIAMRARGLSAKVMVFDADPIKMAEAHMEGYDIVDREEGLRRAEIIITATGRRDVIKSEDFERMMDGVLLANAGHFGYEINVGDLEKMSMSIDEIKPGKLEEYTLKNGKRVYLLSRGNIVNISAGDGHPIEIMDLSFSLQTLSVLYLVKNGGKLKGGVLDFPEEIDREVAEIYVSTVREKMGRITKP